MGAEASRAGDPRRGDPLTDALAQLHRRSRHVVGGAVADHVPGPVEDPDAAGIALTSVHGRTSRVGHWASPFAMHSLSHPFVLALVLDELGVDEVARHVGFEPSGPATAIAVDAESGRPSNPLVDAGAVVTCGLVPGGHPSERFERIRRHLSAFAARVLDEDEEVATSELESDDRSRGLAYLTLSAGVLPRNVADVVEVYSRQRALLVTAEDLSVMTATLANGGVNPRTGARVVGADVAVTTLSVMATCGLQDATGEWMARVGLPVATAISGGVAAARPSQYGIGVYSPRVDERGISVRGAAVLRAMSSEFGLHLFVSPSAPPSPIAESVERDGRRVVVLRGELDLLAAETVIDHVATVSGGATGARRTDVVLDLTAVTHVQPVAESILAASGASVVAGPTPSPAPRRFP